MASTVAQAASDPAAVVAERIMKVHASRLDAAVGEPIDRLSLVAWGQDGFHPVPFQVDELDEYGLVWFPASDHERVGKGGVFDGQDLLLALYRDAGRRAPAGAKLAHGRVLAEIRLRNPVGSPRYFYLVHGHEARSPKRYVHQNLATGVTQTPWYRLEVDPDNELNWQYLDYRTYQGQGSIIQSLEMRMSAGILSRFARVSLTNENLDPELIGFKAGPIRTVMHLETQVVVVGIPVMTLQVQVMRYPNHYAAYTVAEIPFLYRATLKEPKVSVSLIGNDLLGSTIRTARSNGLMGRVNGHMSEAEKTIVERGLNTRESWILFNTRKSFILLTQLDVGRDLTDFPLELVYRDNGSARKIPRVGYSIRGWPPGETLRFSIQLLFDNSLHGMTPARYAFLRTGDGRWIRIQSARGE